MKKPFQVNNEIEHGKPGGKEMRKTDSKTAFCTFLFLLLVGCGAPMISVEFDNPGPGGFDLGVPAISLDVMVLSVSEPDEKGFPTKMENPDERRAWFDERDPKLRELRKRLYSLEQLRSCDVTQNDQSIAPVLLQSPEGSDWFVVFVLVDIPSMKEPYAWIKTDRPFEFTVKLGSQKIEIKPKSDS